MLFNIPFIADWKKIGEHRQLLTNRNTARKNEGWIDYDYQVGQKVVVRNNGILRKAESRYLRELWLITPIHTNGTIRVQCGNKSERMNIRRVKPFDDGTDIIYFLNFLHSQQKTYAWLLVSKLTAREIHHYHSIERSFFYPIKVFSSLSHADPSFVGVSGVSQISVL
jgi:hypothetical protein